MKAEKSTIQEFTVQIMTPPGFELRETRALAFDISKVLAEAGWTNSVGPIEEEES